MTAFSHIPLQISTATHTQSNCSKLHEKKVYHTNPPRDIKKEQILVSLLPEQISFVPATLGELLSFLCNITDVEFWVISVIHYEEVDRTLSTESIWFSYTFYWSYSTTSGAKRKIEKLINKARMGKFKDSFVTILCGNFLQRVFYCKEKKIFTIAVRCVNTAEALLSTRVQGKKNNDFCSECLCS